MKSVKMALVFGSMAAFGLGMSAEACSSSSTTGTGPGSSSGSSKSSGSTSTKPTGDGGASNSASSGASNSAGSSGSGSSVTCYELPKAPYPEMAAGVYCPFSETTDGGKALTCTAGQDCCVTPEGTGPSTCVASTDTCSIALSVRIDCEGTPDCAATAGDICCGYGKIDQQGAQPGCAADGGTLPPSAYVSGFAYGPSGVKGTGGTFCAATCTVTTDAGKPVSTFQVCSQSTECPAGNVCTGIKPSGVGLGYCAASDAGAGSSSSSASSSGSSGSGTGDSGT
jgi:hypothetical protein